MPISYCHNDFTSDAGTGFVALLQIENSIRLQKQIMSNWRERLIEGAKSPEQRREEATQRLIVETSDFYANEVLPAFHALESALKEQGKQVEIHTNGSLPSITIHSSDTPSVLVFSYIIAVEEGRTRAFISYLPSKSKNYQDRESNIKPEAQISSVTKDDIADHFTDEYNKVRHDLE